MSLRVVEISRLHDIAERPEFLPEEIRPLGVVLTFDILYDADVFTRDSDQRGGTWGVHFDHAERRQANVKLEMYGYLKITERFFRNSRGKSQSMPVYLITEKGSLLLQHLKDTAGIT
jgi:hypothetical protein